MNFLSDYQRDRDNAVKPFVVVKAHRSRYCGWVPAVHLCCMTKRQALDEIETLMKVVPYCRVERWPVKDGGETIVQEFGVNPGIDEPRYVRPGMV